MFKSDGIKDIFAYYGWREYTRFQIYFIEGTLPTEEEVKIELEKHTGNVGPLTHYNRASPERLLSTFLPSRNEKVLAANNYGNGSVRVTGSNKSYKLDFARSPEKTTFSEAGTIGYVVIVPRENSSEVDYRNSPSIMFFSVGLRDSGADVELTSLEVEEGIDIRMNEIEINY